MGAILIDIFAREVMLALDEFDKTCRPVPRAHGGTPGCTRGSDLQRGCPA